MWRSVPMWMLFNLHALGGVQNSGGRPVEISARDIVRMATICKDGPTGTFQEDDGDLGW